MNIEKICNYSASPRKVILRELATEESHRLIYNFQKKRDSSLPNLPNPFPRSE